MDHLSEEYVMDFSDDSHETLDVDGFCYIQTDAEVLSAKGNLQEDASQSSDLDDEDESDDSDELDRFLEENESNSRGGGFLFKTTGYAKCNNVPTLVKYNKEVNFIDLVKEHILPFLPAKSLVRFRTVSKDWNQWILGPFLAHKQSYCFRHGSGFYRQRGPGSPHFLSLDPSSCGVRDLYLTFLPEPAIVMSSCCGLLLCQSAADTCAYYVCNPVNEQWHEIPRPTLFHGAGSSAVLVFEPSELNFLANYHIICGVPLLDTPIVDFEIYSSETNSWSHSSADCIELGFASLKEGGFYLNGNAYWETGCGNILAFDFKKDTCTVLPDPGSSPSGVLTHRNRELCYIRAYYRDAGVYVLEIYACNGMKLKECAAIQDNDVENCQKCKALPCVNDDTLAILIGTSVYTYRLTDEKVEVIMISETRNNLANTYIPYVNSLVCLQPK